MAHARPRRGVSDAAAAAAPAVHADASLLSRRERRGGGGRPGRAGRAWPDASREQPRGASRLAAAAVAGRTCRRLAAAPSRAFLGDSQQRSPCRRCTAPAPSSRRAPPASAAGAVPCPFVPPRRRPRPRRPRARGAHAPCRTAPDGAAPPTLRQLVQPQHRRRVHGRPAGSQVCFVAGGAAALRAGARTRACERQPPAHAPRRCCAAAVPEKRARYPRLELTPTATARSQPLPCVAQRVRRLGTHAAGASATPHAGWAR